ncbi:endothelin-converting enzyme homolog isoform X5 [Cimex lectularius]|uniref:Endothelin-converting enzyme 1 n=1 Tax=Cimex lectularius TaxID=79782 RepID=A0A8I6R6P1_CIMLE|nr:endothelin-converting enzyme homolog isoform X5 [Cimex lectularius]
MTYRMTRYKKADFEEDVSSIGSVQLTEGVSSTATHIRYQMRTSFWKSRTLLEKTLILSVIFLLVIVFILSLALNATGRPDRRLHYLQVNTRPDETDENYCLTETCIKTAATLVSAIDRTSDPCNDFYQFACGNWIKYNPIPDGKSTWGTFAKMDQQNQLILKNALEKPLTSFKSSAEKKAKHYYNSCMDANETIEALGGKPLLDLLKEVKGWSIAGDFDVQTFDLQEKLQILQNKYSFPGLFSWAVNEDDRNSSIYIIQVDQVSLILPTRDKYLNKTEENMKILKVYEDYMTDMGVLLGGEKNRTRKLMKNIIDFETKLAEITIPDEERRDEEKMYHLMTVADLENLAPFIAWLKYFNNALNQVNNEITEKEMIVVYAPQYMVNLTRILSEYMNSTEGKETVNNYLVWQMVNSQRVYLSRNFRDTYKGMKKAILGTEGGEESWRFCVSDTAAILGFAIGAMYVRQNFDHRSKENAEQMINEVRAAFKENLKELTWMDVETRELAENKADAITDMIGFPDYILNTEQLDAKYVDLNINEMEYFQNNINANKYNLIQNLKQLGQPVNRTRWGMTPPTVNAYYTPNRNQIVFPAGILQSPFYDINHQQALNFGAMGVVMGHELIHAFDDQGREYDKYGNMHQWWNNRTIEKFKEQTECVVKQYSNYELDSKKLNNGKQTLGENIADNGGLKAAYRAYIDRVSKSKEEPLLPAVNMTHKQLFFLSFAQVWCSASTDQATNLHVEKDSHSIPKYRVIGSLSNFQEFADNFNCKLGSRMNPKEKCVVW